MEKEIVVQVEKGVKTLEIRKGDAPKILTPQGLKISGTITAPSKFVEKRKDELKDVNTHVLYSYTDKKILLVTEERFENKVTVGGALEFSDELKKLDIFIGNGDEEKMYTHQQLLQKIRFNKSLFKNVEEANEIVKKLAKLVVDVKAKIESEQEEQRRGNKKETLDITVTTNIPMSFTLVCPIYKGFDKKTFLVTICYEVRDRGLSLWLESEELSLLIDGEAEKIIAEEIVKLADYACIEY